MGLVALPAQQFWQRILLFFQQPGVIKERQSGSVPYIKYIPSLRRVHLFTIIQLFFFALLYVVKNFKVISIAFPLFILLCIPVRLYLLPKVFTDDELTLLDGTPEEIEDWILVNATDATDGDGAIMVTTGLIGEDRDIENMETIPQNQEFVQSSSSGRKKQISGLSVKSNGSRTRGGRTKQTSTSSVGSFFENRRARREERERQQSQQSVDMFMRESGLEMPAENPDANDETVHSSDNSE